MAKTNPSTQSLMGIESIGEYSLVTSHGELVFFIVHPTNLSVLSDHSVAGKIYGLMTVLKGVSELEILCLNSKENFDDNKSFLQRRMEEEQNPVLRELLQKDSDSLDRMQIQMVTAREFLVVIRLRKEKAGDMLPYLSQMEKSLKDQGFTTRRADSEDIKRMLAVYYEQNVTSDHYENFDGERWVMDHG